MIYLKEFATAQDYEDVKNNLPKPNVSLITNGSEVKYMKETTPPTPVEHEYVDLGLPSGTLWATMNIGASSITDTGLYYQWGDSQGYEYNSREWEEYTYKWYDSNEMKYTKYNHTDGKRVLDDADDAAIAAWGNGWHIPTKTQLTELINNEYVTTAFTENYLNSGVDGLLITSKTNGNSIFLPYGTEIGTEYNRAVYHSNETFGQYPLDSSYELYCGLYSESNYGAHIIDKNSIGELRRWYGESIRPVKDA